MGVVDVAVLGRAGPVPLGASGLGNALFFGDLDPRNGGDARARSARVPGARSRGRGPSPPPRLARSMARARAHGGAGASNPGVPDAPRALRHRPGDRGRGAPVPALAPAGAPVLLSLLRLPRIPPGARRAATAGGGRRARKRGQSGRRRAARVRGRRAARLDRTAARRAGARGGRCCAGDQPLLGAADRHARDGSASGAAARGRPELDPARTAASWGSRFAWVSRPGCTWGPRSTSSPSPRSWPGAWARSRSRRTRSPSRSPACRSLTVVGLGNAGSVRVGLAVGARDRAGARRAGVAALGGAAAFMSASAVCLLVFPSWVARP